MGRGSGIRWVGEDSVQIDFRWRGRRCRERLRLAQTKENERFAKRLKAVIEHEIATGTFDYAKHFPRSKQTRKKVAVGVPLKDSLLAYVESLSAELEPETLRVYRKDAVAVAGWFPADETLQTLTRPKIRDAIAKVPLSKKRILNILIPLRGAVGQAADDGDLVGNPFHKLKIRRLRKPDDEEPQPFTPAEIAALGKVHLGDLWTAWAWSGLRPGEIIGLECDDLDFSSGKIKVRRAFRVAREKAPKSAAGKRDVVMLPAARAALERVSGTGAVFRNPNTGKRWHEDRAIARAFRIACAQAGVTYRPPKHLRHTYASWALSSGENPMWVAGQMGHEDTTMIFKVYAKWIPAVDPHAGSRMLSLAKAG